MRVAHVLEAKARTFPKKAAYIHGDRTITFKELREKVFRLANTLSRHPDLRFGKDDKIAVYLPNSVEYVYSYLALWCTGAVVVPLDFSLTQDEIESIIRHADVKVVITQEKETVDWKAVKKKCRTLSEVILCGRRQRGMLQLDELIEKGEDEIPPVVMNDNDHALIFYTSGTTGAMKGVLVNYLQLGVPSQSMEYFVDLSHRDTTVCALPLSHLGGLIYILNGLNYAMTVVLMDRFLPREFLAHIQNHKASCFWCVPSMYYAFLNVKDIEQFDLSSLRWVVTFGASSSADALRKFHRLCPRASILNGWGLTETNAPTTVLPLGSDKIESVGKAPPWVHIKIFNELGKELPAGEVGEIVVRGWIVTEGYYKDPKATEEAFRYGWFHTGDLGKFDAEGFLYIVGRKKEVIKVGGELVYEPEVEAVIYKHPAVAEVAVIGVKDAMRGEVPKAFIVLKEGEHLNEVELRHFLREHLANFKLPHHYAFVPYLTKNRTGKIDKETLRSSSG